MKPSNPLLQVKPLKAAIADEIRGRIVDGRYPPGSRVSEKELTLELGASRTPVREALLQLQAEGLIVMRPQSGTFVFDPTAGEVRDLCELRGIYEAGALRLAAARDAAGLAAVLSATVKAARVALRASDLAACERLDREFHEAIIARSGNALLVESYRRIADKVNVLRHQLPRTRERMGKALLQHAAIVELVAGGKVSSACAELAAHVRNVQALLAAAGGKQPAR